ncbi:hypothetical protein ACVWY3_005134 [Bradyrhizobium sp. USDA 4486]
MNVDQHGMKGDTMKTLSSVTAKAGGTAANTSGSTTLTAPAVEHRMG